MIGNMINFCKRNIGRLALVLVFAIAWIPLLFYYSDLRSIISTTISRNIGDGFSIDFTSVSLAPAFPIALELRDFEFIGPGIPVIAAERVVAQPSLGAIFTRTPGGSVEAEGIFKGNITAALSSGKKIKNGHRQDIKATVSGIQLAALTEALRRSGTLSFNVLGALDANGSVSIDSSFEEQPEADLFIKGKTISIPSVSIPVPNMGAVLTPSLLLGSLEFTGRMAEGKIQVDNFTFGQSGDSLTGRVRGEISLSVKKSEQGTNMVPGAFDLKVELNISKSLMDAMTKSGVGLALLMVEKFKSMSGETAKFAFRVRAPVFGAPPTFEALVGGT